MRPICARAFLLNYFSMLEKSKKGSIHCLSVSQVNTEQRGGTKLLNYGIFVSRVRMGAEHAILQELSGKGKNSEKRVGETSRPELMIRPAGNSLMTGVIRLWGFTCQTCNTSDTNVTGRTPGIRSKCHISIMAGATIVTFIE